MTARLLRIVLHGATGIVGRELLEVLEDGRLPLAEICPVASDRSVGSEVDFAAEPLSVEPKLPALVGRDLVFSCVPADVALETIREALRAEVPCVDCSGAMSARAEVPLVGAGATPSGAGEAPILAVAGGTALALAAVLEALLALAPVVRVDGTILRSASAWGRRGIDALSRETVALLNQTQIDAEAPAHLPRAFDCRPALGPAGRPGAASEDVDRAEIEVERLLGGRLRPSLSALQVPGFVGEGLELRIEFAEPVERADLERALIEAPSLDFDPEDVDVPPPSIRDAGGRDEVLVGQPRAKGGDATRAREWGLWLATDPARLVAEALVRGARARLGVD